jgi:PAS domain S-box-containing protein
MDPRTDPPAPSAPQTQRLSGQWWWGQSPEAQDRRATLAPLASVLLFLAVISSTSWYLHTEETQREAESLRRDTEIAQQQIRLRFTENEERLAHLAQDVGARSKPREAFIGRATELLRDRPEISRLWWLAPDGSPVATVAANGSQEDDDAQLAASPKQYPDFQQGTFGDARKTLSAAYSKPFVNSSAAQVFEVHVPLVTRKNFLGMLVAQYSTDGLIRYLVAPDISNRHTISVVDASGQVLASTVVPLPGDKRLQPALTYEVPVLPSGNGLMLRAQAQRTSAGLIGNTLFWMVVALSALTVWMLFGTWRHVRSQSKMQRALVSEANFRRAMENSMLTGMRAMDMAGRITYVNPAFCLMTGFSESELIGLLPPFPYWLRDRIEESHRLLQQELLGLTPAGGFEVKVRHKGGDVFDARMYVSPLVDPKGVQTGWMTSMTNITESKRIRDQLSASHERFTTVLESLDASVSVLSVQQGELLFANRSYRLWFGADALGHALLAGDDINAMPVNAGEDSVEDLGGLPTQELTESGSDPHEIHVQPLNKWFDVRARYLQWTDGRLAQMLIATDVTARRNAESLAANQAEKAQVTSRLVTMGEMASSVAHELNQPLTAISNYCNGMVSRVKAESIEKDDLINALEKTSKQAQRAGQIIHRIRAFVKRSEPQRQATQARTIVEEVVELASIELSRRKVVVHFYVASRLPALWVDPILIEQVLLNLLKNAAEAIDSAGLPAARRIVNLRVVPRQLPDDGAVIEFSVTDMGPGIRPEVLARLYEAFFSTKPEGLGIGLSLCRSIIESHRGRIRAENLYTDQKVSGCSFVFTLPVEIDPIEPHPQLNTALTP